MREGPEKREEFHFKMNQEFTRQDVSSNLLAVVTALAILPAVCCTYSTHTNMTHKTYIYSQPSKTKDLRVITYS